MSRKSPSRSGVRARAETPRILVVDDDEDNRELVATFLQDRGFEVHTATNGEEGVAIAVSWRPDVIIMDVAMPELDGWEATRRIRSAKIRDVADVVIIVLTAFADRTSREQSLEAGCDLHLVKPVRPDVLAQHITTAIASRPLTSKRSH